MFFVEVFAKVWADTALCWWSGREHTYKACFIIGKYVHFWCRISTATNHETKKSIEMVVESPSNTVSFMITWFWQYLRRWLRSPHEYIHSYNFNSRTQWHNRHTISYMNVFYPISWYISICKYSRYLFSPIVVKYFYIYKDAN